MSNTSRERIFSLTLGLLAAAFVLAVGLCFLKDWGADQAAEAPVLAAPAASAPAAPAERRVLAVPMFKQWDPRWGNDALGGSGEQMRFAGCTVSCVAMSFKFYGLDTDPGRFNSWLRANDGYTGKGLLKWDKCVEYAGGRVALDYVGEPDEPRMRRALSAGRPAIVKVLLASGVNHWVLVVGTAGPDYVVNDPLDLGAEPALLSGYGRRVYALRIFRPVPRKNVVTAARAGI